MSQIDLIRKGIEGLKGQLVRGACAAQVQMETDCKEEAYNELLSILDDIESGCSEKPNDHKRN